MTSIWHIIILNGSYFCTIKLYYLINVKVTSWDCEESGMDEHSNYYRDRVMKQSKPKWFPGLLGHVTCHNAHELNIGQNERHFHPQFVLKNISLEGAMILNKYIRQQEVGHINQNTKNKKYINIHLRLWPMGVGIYIYLICLCRLICTERKDEKHVLSRKTWEVSHTRKNVHGWLIEILNHS